MTPSNNAISAAYAPPDASADFYDVRSFLDRATTLEGVVLRTLWCAYYRTFAPTSGSFLATRFGQMNVASNEFLTSAPRQIYDAVACIRQPTYNPVTWPIAKRSLAYLLARIPQTDLLTALKNHFILAYTPFSERVTVAETPLVKFCPCGSLSIRKSDITIVANQTTEATLDILADRNRGRQPVEGTNIQRFAWFYRTAASILSAGYGDQTCASIERCLVAGAVPIIPTWLTASSLPASNIAAMVNTNVYAFSDLPDTADVQAFAAWSFFGLDAKTVNYDEFDYLQKFVIRVQFYFRSALHYDSVQWPFADFLSSLSRFAGKTIDTDTTAMRTLSAIEAVGASLSDGFSLKSIGMDDDDTDDSSSKTDDTTDDTSVSADAKKADGDDDSSGDPPIDDGTDPGTDPTAPGPSDRDTGTGTDGDPGANDPPGGGLNNNPIGQGSSYSEYDIDLLKGGSDQADKNAVLYRCLVASMNSALEQTPDAPVSNEVRLVLSDWCKYMLFTVKLSQTKDLLKRLGLDKVLKQTSLRGL